MLTVHQLVNQGWLRTLKIAHHFTLGGGKGRGMCPLLHGARKKILLFFLFFPFFFEERLYFFLEDSLLAKSNTLLGRGLHFFQSISIDLMNPKKIWGGGGGAHQPPVDETPTSFVT